MERVLGIIAFLALFWCLGCKNVQSTRKTETSNFSFDCDRLLEKFESEYPGFSRHWKNDSLGCNGFRRSCTNMGITEIFYGYSKNCLEELLGEPNIISNAHWNGKENAGLTYIIKQDQCSRVDMKLALGFNEHDVLNSAYVSIR